MNIIKSLDVFKEYCKGLALPSYIKKYVSRLSDDEYDGFYIQVKEAMSYLIDLSHIISEDNYDKLYAEYFSLNSLF